MIGCLCSVQLADKFIAVFLRPSLLKIDGKPTVHLKQNVDRCWNRFLPAVCYVVVLIYTMFQKRETPKLAVMSVKT